MEIQKLNPEQMTLQVVSQTPRLQSFLGLATLNCLESPTLPANDKELVLTYYSSQRFSLKEVEYWGKGNRNGLSGQYAQWMILLNIRSVPDEITVQAVVNCLRGDYGHLNENCVTEAIKMNLRGEFNPTIEAYQLINEHFLIKLLTAYNAKLLEAHRIAVNLRNKSLEPVEPTPEELEQKNISAMKSVFAEFKATGNENLISGLYFDFFHTRGLITLTNDQKRDYLKKAQIKLKEIKTTREGMISADKIIKSIDAGGYEEEVRAIGRKLAIIDFFNTTSDLPF